MKPQNKHSHAAATKSAKRSEGFRKRTITPLEFVGAVASIATEASTLQKIWVDREMDPGFREKLMFAVARHNDAKYCSWAHHEWAVIEGVSEKELAHIEQLDRTHFDRKTWLAITFVRELIATNFGRVSRARMQQMRACYSAEEIRQITLVARVMDALNLSSNTFDAFLSRLSGRPSPKGRIIDEAHYVRGSLLRLPSAARVLLARIETLHRRGGAPDDRLHQEDGCSVRVSGTRAQTIRAAAQTTRAVAQAGRTGAPRARFAPRTRRSRDLTHAAEREVVLDLKPLAERTYPASARRRRAFSSGSSVGAAPTSGLPWPHSNSTNLTLRKLRLDSEPDVRKSEGGVLNCATATRSLAEIADG